MFCEAGWFRAENSAEGWNCENDESISVQYMQFIHLMVRWGGRPQILATISSLHQIEVGNWNCLGKVAPVDHFSIIHHCPSGMSTYIHQGVGLREGVCCTGRRWYRDVWMLDKYIQLFPEVEHLRRHLCDHIQTQDSPAKPSFLIVVVSSRFGPEGWNCF